MFTNKSCIKKKKILYFLEYYQLNKQNIIKTKKIILNIINLVKESIPILPLFQMKFTKKSISSHAKIYNGNDKRDSEYQEKQNKSQSIHQEEGDDKTICNQELIAEYQQSSSKFGNHSLFSQSYLSDTDSRSAQKTTESNYQRVNVSNVEEMNESNESSLVQRLENSDGLELSHFQTVDDIDQNDHEMNQLLNQFNNMTKNNIGKNLIKAFFAYLLDTNQNDLLSDFVSKGIQVQQARKMANTYYKQFIFNNKSLHKLIEHSKYGKAFEFYLTFEAENWLAESKVKEKQNHLIYIDFLKLCCSDSIFSDNLVTYKKNKSSKFNDRA